MSFVPFVRTTLIKFISFFSTRARIQNIQFKIQLKSDACLQQVLNPSSDVSSSKTKLPTVGRINVDVMFLVSDLSEQVINNKKSLIYKISWHLGRGLF
jgi:hypothetical protein